GRAPDPSDSVRGRAPGEPNPRHGPPHRVPMATRRRVRIERKLERVSPAHRLGARGARSHRRRSQGTEEWRNGAGCSPWEHRVLGAHFRDWCRSRCRRPHLTHDRRGSTCPESVHSAFEGGESVVDVCRSEFQRLTKLSYLSGGKSLCNIENNARPSKERVNGSCGIDREIRVRLFKPFPLVIVHLLSHPRLARWQASLVCPSLSTASHPVAGTDGG